MSFTNEITAIEKIMDITITSSFKHFNGTKGNIRLNKYGINIEFGVNARIISLANAEKTARIIYEILEKEKNIL